LETPQTILQSLSPPDLAPPADTRLPEVFFWAPRKELPRFAKPFVEPGHQTRPAQPRLLDAPPKLEMPAAEPAALNIPQLPESRDALRLLTPPALPVRASDAQNRIPQTGVSADSTSGDPTDLLSLAIDPLRMREFLTVPPGNQLGNLPEASASGSTTLTAASGTSSGAAAHPGPSETKPAQPAATPSASTPAPAAPAAATAPTLAAAPNAPAAPAASTLAATPATSTPDEPAAAEPAEGSAASLAALRAMALAAAAPTRVVHPAGGVFDVVVQSSGTGNFAESSGVLSGKPVYSAYVRAGGGKDWLLQYCVPAGDEAAVQTSGQVVRLTSGAPLVAPFPQTTMRPPVRPRPGRHVMVHGYITPQGRFRDLKVLGASASSEAEMVLAVLDQWEFRAASRDGQPLEVEILLAIPTD
jgi:hypothetical protein